MKRYLATILKFSEADKEQLKDYCEDSIVTCPQIGKRVLFVEGYKNLDLLDKPLIKLREVFYVDDGEKYITVTLDNLKELKSATILTEKTDKYDVEEIKDVKIIKK